MNFRELYEKAEKNAQRIEKKVREADNELENKRRIQMERLAIERAREKMDLKRKIPPPPPVNHHKKSENFVIPRKKQESSNLGNDERQQKSIPAKEAQSSSSAKIATKCSSKNPPKLVVKQPDEQQRRPLMNKPKGKIERRPAHQSSSQIKGKMPVQQKPKSSVQNYQQLLEQAAKNDASTVEQLLKEVESKSTPNIPAKKARMDASEEVGISAGLMLTHSAAREKAAAAKAENYRTTEIRQKSHSEQEGRNQRQKNTANVSLPSSTKIQAQNRKQLAPSAPAPPPPRPTISGSNHQSAKKPAPGTSQQKILSKEEAIRKLNGAAVLKRNDIKSNKMKISMPSKNKETDPSVPSKDAAKSTSQPSQPQKRYLPGDIRYTGPPEQKSSKVPIKKTPSATSTTIAKSATSTNLPKIKEKFAPPPLPKKNANPPPPPASKLMKQPRLENEQPAVKRQREMVQSSASTKGRGKEMPGPLKRPTEKSGKFAMGPPRGHHHPMAATAKAGFKACGRAPMESDGTSLARIKKEAYERIQMLKQQRNHPRPYHRPPPSAGIGNNSRKYANYSETDDDDEEEDDRDEYGGEDEYDSDLADFIDDSMVDDLQREDLEETLRIINPRYNKEKWLFRERMIDDRKMDSRFTDVELEERRSARLGLVEDLMEAKRGSKALA